MIKCKQTNPGAFALDHPGLVGVWQERVGGDEVVGCDLPLVEPAVGLGEERDLDALVVYDGLEMGHLSKVQDAVAVQDDGPIKFYTRN